MFLSVNVNLYWDCFYANDRYDEVKQTFDVNLVNPLFDQIICYYSSKNKNNYIPETSDKVKVVEIRSPHPYFDDLFHLTNHYSSPYDINILCNNDIIFGKWDKEQLNNKLLPESFFCLSRHELKEPWTDHTIENLPNYNDELLSCSQDVWIYRGKIKPTFGHFPKGSNWGNETIGEESFRNGYFPSNPSKSFPTFHNHLSNLRIDWPNEWNKSRHMYTHLRGECQLTPYNIVNDVPYPLVNYFNFELPTYTPILI